MSVGPVAEWVSIIAAFVNYPTPIPIYIVPGMGNAVAFLGNQSFIGDESIVYDPYFINYLSQKYSDAAPIAVLAHKMGHLIHGQWIPGNIPDWGDETRADYFAGFALARFGIPRRPIQYWLINETIADSRHPDGYTRAWIIEQGYINGGGNPWL